MQKAIGVLPSLLVILLTSLGMLKPQAVARDCTWLYTLAVPPLPGLPCHRKLLHYLSHTVFAIAYIRLPQNPKWQGVQRPL